MKELQQFVECLKLSIIEKDGIIARAQKEHNEVLELKKALSETEKSKSIVEGKVKEEGRRIKWMEGKLRELEQAMEQCEQETQNKVLNEVQVRQ